jgi:uncharacterized protein YndB with AHSA1/START domain
LISIECTAHSTAPRDRVWQLLADLPGWHEWGPWTRTDFDGELRTMVSERKRITGKPYVLTERVTALVPGERLEYDLVSGLPVRNYHGVARLADTADGGTDIHWSATFDPPWPVFTGLWRGSMLKVITQVSDAVAAAARA